MMHRKLSRKSSSKQRLQLIRSINEQLAQQLKEMDFSFVISDPRQPDMPIIYASSSFYELTGYGPEEVLGRNCRFLQGPETCRRTVMEIRDAIREDRTCQVRILNYKKSGETFWNQFYLAPIFDENNTVKHYIGIQSNVRAPVDESERGVLAEHEVTVVPNHIHDLEEALKSCKFLPSSDIVAKKDDDFAQGPVSSPDFSSSLLCPLMRVQQSFVLADPSLPDTPIVHASQAFLELTGYPRDKVVGHNCRFLQGPDTDPDEVARIREAMTADPPHPVTVTLLNYRYDGTPFWNCLHIAPVRDSRGKVVLYVGVQLDVSHVDAGEEGTLRPVEPSMRDKLKHNSAVGAVRVAVRSLSGKGLRRSHEFQVMPH